MANKWSNSPYQTGLLTGALDYKTFYTPDPTHLPKVAWRPPKATEMPSWKDAKRVSIDVECKDEDLKAMGPGVRREGSRVVGFGFAIEDGPAHYLSLSHHGGDNCDWDVWRYVADQLRDFKGVLVGNGVGYDLDWIEQELERRGETARGNSILRHRVMDVQVAEVLIDENQMRYNLDALCTRYDLPGKDETVLREAANLYRVDPKVGLWKLPARFAAAYGIADCRRPLQILRRQERVIESEDVGKIWELEQQVTPVLIKMRRRGVRIDLTHLEAVDRLAYRTEAECLDRVRQLTGVTIKVGDVWKADVLAHALRAAGHVVPKTETRVGKHGRMVGGKDSVDKNYLKKAGKVGAEILRAREWNKLRTTFCRQVRDALIGDRVHCTFNQLKATSEDSTSDEDAEGQGVRYGRLSSSNFNIQQQPVRHDEFGTMWRSVFVADVGARWACSDWSQQEPRIAVHYAELLDLPGAREFAEKYRQNPALDIHQALTDIANDPVNLPRKVVKNFVNGRLYGMGDLKLCRQMNWPTTFENIRGERREVPAPESRAKIEMFAKFAPWIGGLTRVAARRAEERGYVRTSEGRKCRFEKGPDGKIWKAHKAFNRIGQGEAADQMKKTLVAADREGIPIQMAVHDEFDFSFTDIRQARRLKELQKTVKTYNVPMLVDLEIGDNWGQLEKDQGL